MKRFLWMKYFHIGSPESCIGCMKCVKVCPEGVFRKIV
jgi:ferredoxin